MVKSLRAWLMGPKSSFLIPAAGWAFVLAALATAWASGGHWIALPAFALAGWMLSRQAAGRPGGQAGNLEKWTLLLLMVYAAFTHLYGLGDHPPGGHGHEDEMATECIQNLDQGPYKVYIQNADVNWGSLIFYQGLAATKVLGKNVGALRVPAALWGILSVLVLYLVLRTCCGPLASLAASFLFASDLSHLVWSRNFFPGSILYVAPVLGLVAYLKSLKPKWKYLALAGGFFAGLAYHSYIPGRLAGPLFAAWFVWLWFRKSPRFSWTRVGLFWAGFALCLAPLLAWYLQTGGQYYWGYVQNVNPNHGRPLTAYLQTLAGVLPDYAGVFHFRGDPDANIHPAFEPLLSKPVGLLFGAGIFLCLFQAGEPLRFFFLLLFACGLVPAMLGGSFAHPTTRRMVMALPAVYFFCALALDRLAAAVPAGRWARTALLIALALSCAWVADGTLRTYFSRLESAPQALDLLNHHLYRMRKAADAHPSAALFVPSVFLRPGIQPIQFVGRGLKPIQRPEDFLTQMPGQDSLCFLEPLYGPALPLFQRLFPKGGAGEEPNQAGLSNEIGLRFDDYAPASLYCWFQVPASDAVAGDALLERQGQAWSKVVFGHSSFAARRRGSRVSLKGMLVLPPRGCSAIFSLDWPGWKLRLDGRPVHWNRPLQAEGGWHEVDLEGAVPAQAQGGLPLRLVEKDLKDGSEALFLALDWPYGMRGEVLAGGGTDRFAERLPWPFQRFAGIPAGDFTVNYTADLSVEKTGDYWFSAWPQCRTTVFIGGKQVFDNTVSPAVAAPARLEAGRAAAMRVFYSSKGDPTAFRAFQLLWKKPGDKEASPLPAEALMPTRPGARNGGAGPSN